jgi:glycosyltransferase involved in cell wall biosynthesis
MRVLLLNAECGSNDGRTATAEALARGLAGRGAVVDVVTLDARKGRVSQVHWDGVSPEEGSLTVHRVKGYRASLSLTRRLMRAERYDVLHLFSALPAGAILPLLNLRNIPVVVSLHGSDTPGANRNRMGYRLLSPLARWIWRRADRVVVDSESLGRQAQDALPSLRYSLIHPGLDVARFRPRAAHHPRRSDRFRCLTVRRSIGSEGLADLIRALGSLPQERFELEILGAEPTSGPLPGLISRLGVGNRVSFTATPDRDEIARRYRAADLFAVSSWEEAFEAGFAQALSTGLPIVGPEAGPIPSLVHHGRSGLLVALHNPDALARAIQRLADDPPLRARIGRRNRAEAEANFAWERVTGRYLSIYQGLQRRAPHRPLLAELPSSTW